MKYADGCAGRAAYIAYVGGIDINENRLDSNGHQGAGLSEAGLDVAASGRAIPRCSQPHHRPSGDGGFRDFQGPSQSRLTAGAADGESRAQRMGHSRTRRDASGADVVQTETRLGNGWIRLGAGGKRDDPRHDRAAPFSQHESTSTSKSSTWCRTTSTSRHSQTLRTNCKRLIIVLPSFLEIFFGDIRRTQMFQKMAGTTTAPKWGDRMVIGTPMRRPVLAAANRVTSVGSCTLLARYRTVRRDGLSSDHQLAFRRDVSFSGLAASSFSRRARRW